MSSKKFIQESEERNKNEQKTVFHNRNYFDHYITEKNSRLTRSDIDNRINQSLRAKRDFFVFKNLNNQLFLSGEDSSFNNFQKFLSFFTPRIVNANKGLTILSIQGDFRYFEQFEYEGNEILLDFCRFIYDRKKEILLTDIEVAENQYPSAKYNLFDLFTMIEILL